MFSLYYTFKAQLSVCQLPDEWATNQLTSATLKVRQYAGNTLFPLLHSYWRMTVGDWLNTFAFIVNGFKLNPERIVKTI